MKKTCTIFLLLAIFTSLCACDRLHPYQGDRHDLLVVATNSLLGCDGEIFMRSDGPILEVVEEDDYGRVLFYYYENSSFSTHSYIICQKMDDDFVYYYPDYNFISKAYNTFSDEEIDQLKAQNDWNSSSFKIDEMVSSKIENNKTAPDIDEELFVKVIKDKIGDEFRFRFAEYCYSDKQGKHLYVTQVTFESQEQQTVTVDYAIIISEDCSEGWVMPIDDYNNYQEKLATFKYSNGWEN